MKTRILSTMLGCCLLLQYATAQERNNFRKDCNYFREYNEITEEWGEWQKGNSTFAFNINTNNDIRVVYPNGNTEVLRNLGNKEESKTSQGISYESVRVMDEGGIIGWLTLYEDGTVLLSFKGFIYQYDP